METWEIYEASPDALRLVREWAGKRNAVVERIDETTVNVNCETADLEDDLARLCDDHAIKSRLL